MGSSENKTHTHKLTHTNAWTTNRHIHKQKERSRKYPKEGQSFALTVGALVGKCEWRNGASLGKLWA